MLYIIFFLFTQSTRILVELEDDRNDLFEQLLKRNSNLTKMNENGYDHNHSHHTKHNMYKNILFGLFLYFIDII